MRTFGNPPLMASRHVLYCSTVSTRTVCSTRPLQSCTRILTHSRETQLESTENLLTSSQPGAPAYTHGRNLERSAVWVRD